MRVTKPLVEISEIFTLGGKIISLDCEEDPLVEPSAYLKAPIQSKLVPIDPAPDEAELELVLAGISTAENASEAKLSS